MCIVCERLCWRSGGELECSATDSEFYAAMGDEESVRCVVCGRWHSGLNVNDSPTSHCEACDPVIKTGAALSVESKGGPNG